MALPVRPPIEPMLAKLATEIPRGDGWIYEPKWDGFRALVFRDGADVVIQSRDGKPLERYFPEIVPHLKASLPERIVLDGELVIVGERGLDFDAMLLRIHPAKSRIELLSKQTPASYVAWDVLALGDDDLRALPQVERRARLEHALASARPPVFVTPATRDPAIAQDWFERFEGAGFDGVVAKPTSAAYAPGKRIMTKVKHARTADCVLAGFRWHKDGPGTLVGSLLLGLYDDEGVLHHVGICAAFTKVVRAQLVTELAPLREGAREAHPWKAWSEWQDEAASTQRKPGAGSRWNRGKDLSWEPLRPERVVEVAYDHLQGDRFRHATQFVRWRLDKAPADCRYDQLEQTAPAELETIFGPLRSS